MLCSLQAGMAVQHELFGRGSITHVRRAGNSGALEIVVRFCETSFVTVTFSNHDFASFLTILSPEETATLSHLIETQRPVDHNKARLVELERKLASTHVPTTKPPE